MACGTLAVVAGAVDGFRHIAVDRLGGDDVTVMLALLGPEPRAAPFEWATTLTLGRGPSTADTPGT